MAHLSLLISFLVCVTRDALQISHLDPELIERIDKEYYDSIGCNELALHILKGDAAEQPGLIITGQGGSGTRVFQDMVARAGTHYFGIIDPDTKDSMAARWSGVLDHHAEVIQTLGTPNFELSSVEPGLETMLSKDVCKSLLILNDMQEHDRNRPWIQRPWALKEPWLRLMLPFYDEAVGKDGYKVLHVTRDVRNIHSTHGDETLFDPLNSIAELAVVESKQLKAALVGIDQVYASRGARLNLSLEQVRILGEFVFTWGTIELSLKKQWESERAARYFHISGKDMETPELAFATAARLANFLGIDKPKEETVKQMAAAYQQQSYSAEHWLLMNDIVNLDGMRVARDALRAFNNGVSLRTDIP